MIYDEWAEASQRSTSKLDTSSLSNKDKFCNFIYSHGWGHPFRFFYELNKIYGVYLYNLFIPELWGNINQKLLSFKIDFLYNNSIPEVFRPTWLFIQHFSFLMFICFISWKLIEKPVNNLKKRFEYKTPAEMGQLQPEVQGAEVTVKRRRVKPSI